MKKFIPLILLFLICNFTQKSFGDIGPVFDVQMLYKEVPIICKATVQEVQPSSSPITHENRQFEGSSALFKIDRYYKGSGSDTIEVKFPSGKDLSGSKLSVYGWGFRTPTKGQTLLVFLKKEGDGYRFWSDVYDTFMPISFESASNAEGLQAIREDIINSINRNGEISKAAMEQIKMHGWIEVLPKIKSITIDDGYSQYIQALITRLYLGDRSAIDETLKFFDESKQFERKECTSLPKEKQEDCYTLQNAQIACMYAYAELGTKKGQVLMKSIASGKLPWLHSNIINTAKLQLQNIVPPEVIIEAGNKILSISLEECTPICFNWKEPGYKLIKAAGREDWYYSVRYDFENRDKIYSEMRKWWQDEGRKIFAEEME